MKDGGQHSFNLGTGKGLSVREVLKSIEKITSLKIEVENHQRRIGDPPVLIASASKALNELNWIPEFSNIDTIVKHAWKWYKKI